MVSEIKKLIQKAFSFKLKNNLEIGIFLKKQNTKIHNNKLTLSKKKKNGTKMLSPQISTKFLSPSGYFERYRGQCCHRRGIRPKCQ